MLRVCGGGWEKAGVQVDGAGADREIRLNPYKHGVLTLLIYFCELKMGKLT